MNKIILCPLAIVLTMMSTVALGQRCYPDVISFGNERPIDTTEYVKPHNEVEDQEKKFRSYFKLRTGAPLDSSPEVVLLGRMLEKLYFPVQLAMADDDDCLDRKCVAAVKIHYGLVDNDLRLVYEPFYMKWKNTTNHGRVDSMHFDRFQSSLGKFIYQGSGRTGNFVSISEGDAQVLTDQYDADIIRQAMPSQAAARRGPNDSDAAIFSFQEIVKFYHSLHNETAAGRFYCAEMEIHHACTFTRDRAAAPPTAKHTLFFTKKDWTRLLAEKAAGAEVKVLAPFGTGDGANLAHLCPPRCSAIAYPAD